MHDALHDFINPIGLLLGVVIIYLMLIAAYRCFRARQLNSQLGLPVTFQPQNGKRLTCDGIRLEAVSGGELRLRYRMVNTTSQAVEIIPLLTGFSLHICGSELQQGFPFPLEPFTLLPNDSRTCEQTFLFSEWRKHCGLRSGQPFPEHCMPAHWQLKNIDAGMVLTATIAPLIQKG